MVVAGCGWGTHRRAIECTTASSASSSGRDPIRSFQQRFGGRSVPLAAHARPSHSHLAWPYPPTCSPSLNASTMSIVFAGPRCIAVAQAQGVALVQSVRCVAGRSSPATPAHRSRPQATQSADAPAVLCALRPQASSAQGCGSAVAVEVAGRAVAGTPCSCSEVSPMLCLAPIAALDHDGS